MTAEWIFFTCGEDITRSLQSSSPPNQWQELVASQAMAASIASATSAESGVASSSGTALTAAARKLKMRYDGFMIGWGRLFKGLLWQRELGSEVFVSFSFRLGTLFREGENPPSYTRP